MRDRGLTIIELIIVITVIIAAFSGIFTITNLSFRAQNTVENKIKASYLAKEGMEAMRSMRNQGWNNIALLSESTDYFLVASQSENNEWTLTASNPGPIEGVFSRVINIDPVYRDSNDNIGSSGYLDNETREVTVRVSWTQRGRSQEITIPTYLTNWSL